MKISKEQTYINVGWNTKTGTISNKCEVPLELKIRKKLKKTNKSCLTKKAS